MVQSCKHVYIYLEIFKLEQSGATIYKYAAEYSIDLTSCITTNTHVNSVQFDIHHAIQTRC